VKRRASARLVSVERVASRRRRAACAAALQHVHQARATCGHGSRRAAARSRAGVLASCGTCQPACARVRGQTRCAAAGCRLCAAGGEPRAARRSDAAARRAWKCANKSRTRWRENGAAHRFAPHGRSCAPSRSAPPPARAARGSCNRVNTPSRGGPGRAPRFAAQTLHPHTHIGGSPRRGANAVRACVRAHAPRSRLAARARGARASGTGKWHRSGGRAPSDVHAARAASARGACSREPGGASAAVWRRRSAVRGAAARRPRRIAFGVGGRTAAAACPCAQKCPRAQSVPCLRLGGAWATLHVLRRARCRALQCAGGTARGQGTFDTRTLRATHVSKQPRPNSYTTKQLLYFLSQPRAACAPAAEWVPRGARVCVARAPPATRATGARARRAAATRVRTRHGATEAAPRPHRGGRRTRGAVRARCCAALAHCRPAACS
jgi:hypothetical protein